MYPMMRLKFQSNFSIEKYCYKRLLAALFYLSFDCAKNLGQEGCTCTAGHVQAAFCEHHKSAVVPVYEESFVHGVDLRTIFIF